MLHTYYKHKKRKQTLQNDFPITKKKQKRNDTYTFRKYTAATSLLTSISIRFDDLEQIQLGLDLIFQNSKWGKEGDCVISKSDVKAAARQQCSLLFGEVLPSGVIRMSAPDLLNIHSATRVLDMGSGLGKLAVQLFFAHSHLEDVWGIEFSHARFARCRELLRHFCAQNSDRLLFRESGDMEFRVTERRKSRQNKKRSLRFFCGDMLMARFQKQARSKQFDVIICETEVPKNRYATFFHCMKILADRPMTRLMTYHDLDQLQETLVFTGENKVENLSFLHLKKLYRDNEAKRMIHTSWSQINKNGHVFHFWGASD